MKTKYVYKQNKTTMAIDSVRISKAVKEICQVLDIQSEYCKKLTKQELLEGKLFNVGNSLFYINE